MNNPRYTNEAGGIVITQGNGIDLYVDEGDLYDSIVSGAYGPIAAYAAPEPVPLTQSQIDALRQTAYQQEADPIFFKWQRGESTQEAWLDKIADIRNRYPDVIS